RLFGLFSAFARKLARNTRHHDFYGLAAFEPLDLTERVEVPNTVVVRTPRMAPGQPQRVWKRILVNLATRRKNLGFSDQAKISIIRPEFADIIEDIRERVFLVEERPDVIAPDTIAVH